MTPNFVAIGYLIAALCFIAALSSLCSRTSDRPANLIAMIGMAIAVLLTLVSLPNGSAVNGFLILIALALGAGIGLVGVMKIETTAMPQLLAASHSLVGMTAVLVAITALINPHHVNIADPEGRIFDASLFEMGLAAALGAVTFTGSITAAGRLGGILPPFPISLSLRNFLHISLCMAAFLLLIIFMATGSHVAFWMMTFLAFAIGFILLAPIDNADMPVMMSMLNAGAGWAVASIGFTLNLPLLIVTGGVIGSSSSILTHIMSQATNRSVMAVLLGGHVPMVADRYISDDREKTEGVKEPPSG